MTSIPRESSDSVSVEYTMIGDTLKSNSVFDGSVLKVYGDTLTLMPSDSSTILYFLAVDKIRNPEDGLEQQIIDNLIAVPYQLNTESDSIRLYFDHTEQASTSFPFSSNIVHFDKLGCEGVGCFQNHEAENWSMREVHGRVVLTHSFYFPDFEALQINQIDSNGIMNVEYLSSNRFNKGVQGRLVPKSLETSSYSKLRSQLQNSWILDKVIDSDPSLDKNEPRLNLRSINRFNKKHLARLQDINDLNLKLTFTDDQFQLSIDEYSVNGGEVYQLTTDGRYIIVGEGITRKDYIEVLSISNNRLLIWINLFVDFKGSGQYGYWVKLKGSFTKE
jgi:hypothetical protein